MELVLLLVVGLALGFALGWLVARQRVEPAAQGIDPAVLEAQRAQADAQQLQVEAQHARVVAELRHEESAARAEVQHQLSAAEASVAGLREQLEAARQQYLQTVESHRREAKQREAAGQSESKVLQQLAPVASQLRDMQAKVVDLEKQRHEQHGSLAAQIRATRETAEQSKAAAETLSAALRNNSVRGAYGETQLRSLVESAGMIRWVDFSTQESITAESGARRPDMVVNLPGDKQMAVDAKVPFSAFIDASRPDLDEPQRKQLLAQHAKAVKAHVDQLSHKEYWTGLSSSPEFTVAFIPNDSILNAALDADPGLMEHAFSRGIVLATPVNLWSVLKTVAYSWKQDVLTENAKELFDLGNELYARLAKLSDHVAKLGRSLETTVKDYNQFVGSLERRVLVSARKFDRLDEAKVLGETKEIEVGPDRLTANEFTLFEDLERPELPESLFEGEIVEDDHRDIG